MNTLLADSLNWIADELEPRLQQGSTPAEAVLAVLQVLMQQHGNVVFGGDGYSAEWHEKAVSERGLKNIPTTADALPALREASVIKLFESTGVLSPVELESRFEVYAEQYLLSITVEAKLVVDMAKTLIYPAAVSYLSTLASTGSQLTGMGIDLDTTTARTVAEHANAMMELVHRLSAALEKTDFASTEEHMQFCAGEMRGLMDAIRAHGDALEKEVADELWPLPKYQEMLYIK
jgi:glutamine synthetase